MIGAVLHRRLRARRGRRRQRAGAGAEPAVGAVPADPEAAPRPRAVRGRVEGRRAAGRQRGPVRDGPAVQRGPRCRRASGSRRSRTRLGDAFEVIEIDSQAGQRARVRPDGALGADRLRSARTTAIRPTRRASASSSSSRRGLTSGRSAAPAWLGCVPAGIRRRHGVCALAPRRRSDRRGSRSIVSQRHALVDRQVDADRRDDDDHQHRADARCPRSRTSSMPANTASSISAGSSARLSRHQERAQQVVDARHHDEVEHDDEDAARTRCRTPPFRCRTGW